MHESVTQISHVHDTLTPKHLHKGSDVLCENIRAENQSEIYSDIKVKLRFYCSTFKKKSPDLPPHFPPSYLSVFYNW